MRISDWSSDVCSSDLDGTGSQGDPGAARERGSRKAWGASAGSGAGKRLQSDAEDAFDTALFEELRTERRRLAGEANVPAYKTGRAPCRDSVCQCAYISVGDDS